MKKCMICSQLMSLIVTSYRNHPFIDDKNYAKICFCCAWVPVESIQMYSDTGEIEDEQGPFFDHQHLATAEELVGQGTAETLVEARKSIRAVKRLIKQAGVRNLNKLSLKRPKMEYELEDIPVKKKSRKRR